MPTVNPVTIMALNKSPSECRKYRDKIQAHIKHQNETESDFTAIMAEMEELKRTKPVQIKTFSAKPEQQETSHRSMPDMRHFEIFDQQGYGRKSRYLYPPQLVRPLQYSGGGIIRHNSRERRDPYARSRSPSPNVSPPRYGHSPPPKQQHVILKQRETDGHAGNNLQLPSYPAYRQRSLSDSTLPDQNYGSSLPNPPVPSSSYLAPSHNRVFPNSPAPQRRKTQAEIFHSVKSPPRKTSEPDPQSLQIILTSPDGKMQRNIHPKYLRSQVNNSETPVKTSNENGRTRNDLFADIDTFIHENDTMKAVESIHEIQTDFDGDDILEQLILN